MRLWLFMNPKHTKPFRTRRTPYGQNLLVILQTGILRNVQKQTVFKEILRAAHIGRLFSATYKKVFTCKTHAHDDLIAVSVLYAAAHPLWLTVPDIIVFQGNITFFPCGYKLVFFYQFLSLSGILLDLHEDRSNLKILIDMAN